MALAKRLKELLEALEMDLETYLKKHYELFEACLLYTSRCV